MVVGVKEIAVVEVAAVVVVVLLVVIVGSIVGEDTKVSRHVLPVILVG